MALTKGDWEKLAERDEKLLSKIGTMMDEKMLDFHEKMTEPMANNIVEGLHEDMDKMESRLDGRMNNLENKMDNFEKKMDNFENNQYRIEKKLDNITDHHSNEIDDHEKRIVRLEGRAISSL